MGSRNQTGRRKRLAVLLRSDPSDDELARTWTLEASDLSELKSGFRSRYRLGNAIQVCVLRRYGRFLASLSFVSPRIVSHVAQQLGGPAPLEIPVPDREATRLQQQRRLLDIARFRRFDDDARAELEAWLVSKAQEGHLPDGLDQRAELYLLRRRILCPASSTLERMAANVCAGAQKDLFERIHADLSPGLRARLDQLLSSGSAERRSFFQRLKESPPSASVRSINQYLLRYEELESVLEGGSEPPSVDPEFAAYLASLARVHTAWHLRRFREHKRYALMACFLHESRKEILDHLVEMHDQYVLSLLRQARWAHESEYRARRRRQSAALGRVLGVLSRLLEMPADEPVAREDLIDSDAEPLLRESLQDLRAFRRLQISGYGERLVARYPTLRKYFRQFLELPFEAASGNEALLGAIELVRSLDSGSLRRLPDDAETSFVPKELRPVLRDAEGRLQRNAWELGLALAIRTALRAGDLYLPKSKQHVSFWNLILDEPQWESVRPESYAELGHPPAVQVQNLLADQLNYTISKAEEAFADNGFATVVAGRLKLKRNDLARPRESRLHQTISANLPRIRVENLLMEVDRATAFTRSFVPLEPHRSRPEQFYKSLLAAIISQSTNLGVVAMAQSVPGVTLDMLRHTMQHYLRDETLKDANAAIVDAHHQLPLSSLHGDGRFSSSDAQRFKIRADSLLGSYYPRYFGYYDRAISLYTHVSDQFSVFATRAISCGPREALYVLDGLLDNNTILRIRDHTTDTDGYTEIVFALCHLLGFQFLPRIKNLSDQQLYRLRGESPDRLGSLLSRSVDPRLIEEQWDQMVRLAWSLRSRTAPANVIVQRLTNASPHDRLTKAVRHLGRLVKTRYILRYCSDTELRRSVRLQLNKGEYRQRLSRWIFFAQQGEFTTADYVEIMNKASCLSLVSNAILYWNTEMIRRIVNRLEAEGAEVSEDELRGVSLLPFRHVMPNGTYFIEDLADEGPGAQLAALGDRPP